jgi:ribosomal protein S18 acetylase RimI-like enzyme
MTAPEITVATPADREQVVESLVGAFAGDPVLRHLFPDEDTYPAYAGAFFGHLFDRRVGGGSIFVIEGGRSVAIWETPAGGDDTAGDLAALLPAGALARVREYNAVVHAAMPPQPYWYLGVLGTHPDAAGRGWGRLVMAEGLRRAAAEGVPAVLETATPVNVGIYRRAGWEVLRTLDQPVPTWIMQR